MVGNNKQQIMSNIVHIPSFISKQQSELIYNELLTTIEWEKSTYFKHNFAHYELNGLSKELNVLLWCVQCSLHKTVVSAFLNYYETGNDYAPYHADKYGCDTCLVSLGTTRTLRYKHNDTKLNTDYVLNDGDILIVPNETNNDYKHSLLKRTKLSTGRISILILLQ